MRKAVLQTKMALDNITASQGGTSATIQTECCVFIPGRSAGVLSLLSHVRTQVSELTPQPRGPNKSVIRIMGLLVEKNCLGKQYLNAGFPLVRTYTVAVVPATNAARELPQTSHLCASETLYGPLRAHCGRGGWVGLEKQS